MEGPPSEEIGTLLQERSERIEEGAKLEAELRRQAAEGVGEAEGLRREHAVVREQAVKLEGEVHALQLQLESERRVLRESEGSRRSAEERMHDLEEQLRATEQGSSRAEQLECMQLEEAQLELVSADAREAELQVAQAAAERGTSMARHELEAA